MSAYEGQPGTSLSTEQQIANALSAQYRSTYSSDYLGIPQGMEWYGLLWQTREGLKGSLLCAVSL